MESVTICGHKMCDLCGTRECSNHANRIRQYGKVWACDSCLPSAVNFSYEACCRWGGTTIDVSQPCGKPAHI